MSSKRLGDTGFDRNRLAGSELPGQAALNLFGNRDTIWLRTGKASTRIDGGQSGTDHKELQR
jgi:hypothetical protein